MPAPSAAQPLRVASDTRHLCLLVALDDTGSLHAAARRLHLTPSALSQQLRELEQRMGGPLFQRRWRRLGATPAARHLIAGARSVLAELGRVEAETRRLLAGATATLRIATGCQTSYRWLPTLLARFAEREPTVDLNLFELGPESPAEGLLAGRLDAALVCGEVARDRRLRPTRLFRDELVAVVSRRHAWSALPRVHPAAFAHEHLFTDAGGVSLASPLGRALHDAGGVAPRKLTIVPTAGTAAIDLVRASLGVAVAPHFTVAPELASRDLVAVRIGARGLWLDWSVITRNEPAAPALHAFLEALHAHHPRASEKPTPRRRA